MIAPQYTDLWPLIQADILGVLQADDFIGARPGVLVEPGDQQSVISSKIAKTLGQGSDGKAGVGYLVLPIERVEDEDISNPFGPFKLTIAIQFVENVTVNQGAAGTGVPIRIYAARCAKILKLYTPVGLTQNLVSRNPVISEFTDNDDSARRVGQVEFTAREADFTPLIRLNRPQVSVTGDVTKLNDLNYQINSGAATVTVTQADAEQIYYTTDGSHPFAGNKTAQLYTGPVAVTNSGLFRARAFATGKIGSDTAAVNFV